MQGVPKTARFQLAIFPIVDKFVYFFIVSLFSSLHADMSFEGAEGNIQKLLDRNKKFFYQLPTDALDGIITTDGYKLVFFLVIFVE